MKLTTLPRRVVCPPYANVVPAQAAQGVEPFGNGTLFGSSEKEASGEK